MIDRRAYSFSPCDIRPERSRRQRVALSAVIGTGTGVAVFFIRMFEYIAVWNELPGYILAGLGISFFAWGSERLFQFTLGGLFRNAGVGRLLLVHIPFWFMAGAVGFEVMMLLAIKFGLSMTRDVPVKEIFLLGGRSACVTFLILQSAFIWLRSLQEPEPAPLTRNGSGL